MISHHIPLHTFPVFRSSFIPTTEVHAEYKHSSIESRISAKFKWNTKRPTINLDNFAEIVEIDCKNDLVSITFDSPESAVHAHDAWTNITDFAVILGHEHKCKGIGNVTTLSVEKVLAPKGIELVLDTLVLDNKDVFDDFEVDINKLPGSEQQRGRDIVRFKKHQVDWNYNRQNQSIINHDKNFKFAPGIDNVLMYAEVHCRECFVTGDVNIGIHLKVRFGVIRAYKVRVNGDLKASVDLDVFLQGTLILPIASKVLADIPLSPIMVPGVFTFGPGLELLAVLDIRLVQSVQLRLGYNYTHKFDFAADSGDDMKIKPKTNYKGFPVIIPTVAKMGEDQQARLVTHLIPIIKIGMTVHHHTFALNLGLDNAVIAKVTAGVGGDCKKGRVNIALVKKHDVDFWVGGEEMRTYGYNFYSTGDMNLFCAFCNKCIEA